MASPNGLHKHQPFSSKAMGWQLKIGPFCLRGCCPQSHATERSLSATLSEDANRVDFLACGMARWPRRSSSSCLSRCDGEMEFHTKASKNIVGSTGKGMAWHGMAHALSDKVQHFLSTSRVFLFSVAAFSCHADQMAFLPNITSEVAQKACQAVF